MELTLAQRRKLEKLAAIVDKGNVAVLEHLLEIEDTFDEKIKSLKDTFFQTIQDIRQNSPDLNNVLASIKGKDGEDSTIPGPKGDRGEDGYTPIKNVDYFDGIAGKNGRDGKDAISPNKDEIVRDVVMLIPTPKDGKDGINGSSDDGKAIVDKINALEIEPDLQIDLEHIKGWKKEIDAVRNSIPRGGGGGTSKRKIRAYSLTSQCNGSTKTFTVPGKTTDVIGVFGTEFPINFDAPNNSSYLLDDWSFSGRTITLGSTVPAPDTGQTFWCLIESLF